MQNNHLKCNDAQTILFVSHSSLLYGAERCLLDFVLNLPSRIRPIVLLPSYGQLTKILAENKIDYIVIHYMGWTGSKYRFAKGSYRFFANIVAYLRTIWFLRKFRIDLVYINTLFAPIGALLSRSLRVPLVWHVHEFVDENLPAKFDFGLRISMKLVNKLSKYILCNSNALSKNLSQFVSDLKIKVVYNGLLENVNVNSAHPRSGMVSRDKIGLLIVASITPNKGQYYAIMALCELIKMGENVELIVLGDGIIEYIIELKSLADQLGVADRIKWEGYKNNVAEYYQLSDILLVCSQFETFGNVIVEAMSNGCPVVASNTGGIPEIITDGYDGLLYRTSSYHELAEKVACLINDNELYVKISKNSIRTAYSRFRKDRYVSDLVNICDKAMARCRLIGEKAEYL